MTKATPALSPKFKSLLASLEAADRAFSDAIDLQGAEFHTADKKRKKKLHALECKNSDAADKAWMAFCRYRPETPEELAQYLQVVLKHERVESQCDFAVEDVPHVAHILKNANAALVNLLFERVG